VESREVEVKVYRPSEHSAFKLESQAVLSLFAIGNTTSLAVESGEGVIQIVAVVDRPVLTNATHMSELAGSTVTDVLVKKLQARGVLVGLETACDIKEK
ncbi:hypothetical protein BGZ52_007821, partial [Haplosporangium bisporale]